MSRAMLCFLFCCCSLFSIAQFSLSGVITDWNSKEPVDAAHIFLENTTFSTLTDEQGQYRFDKLPEGTYKLVVSHISYRAVSKVVRVSSATTSASDGNFKLFPSTVDLSTIQVSAKRSRKRNRYLKDFTQAILGQTANASKCKFLNPDKVLLEKSSSGELTAQAAELLQFENKATGYLIHFLLEDFSLDKGGQLSYGGKAFFEPLPSTDEKEQNRWTKNRKKAFLGSPRHFYLSLMDGQLKENGFDVYTAKLENGQKFTTTGRPNMDQLIQASGEQYSLQFKDFIKIIYTREEELSKGRAPNRLGRSAKQLSHRAESDLVDQEVSTLGQQKKRGQTSWLFARKSKVWLNKEGYPTQSGLLVEYGHWNNEGLADFLPMNYRPEKAATDVIAATSVPSSPKASMRNGFALSNLAIPLKEIKSGGPPRDGIPSIDQPKFSSEPPAYLTDKDPVLGVYHNGIAKAYPVRVMDRHEIVNDQFAQQDVIVTYCPLCRSGIAFLTTGLAEGTTFGVSGLLYNSDVLLYDRTTESLWSQILGQAIAGPLAGTKLESIPMEYVDWGRWKERFPETLVLEVAGDKYRTDAYRKYANSPDLMFPVDKADKQLDKKELVIGIEINGKYKAYPFRKLHKQKELLSDTFHGQSLQVHYDAKSGHARITDANGKLLPAVSMYWFAWYAFHPETELY